MTIKRARRIVAKQTSSVDTMDCLPCLEVPIIGVLPMLEPCPPAQSRDWANYQENLIGQIDHRIVEPLMLADKSVEERVLHGI
jgi:hypothetical protein